jgi:hypothetical protein
VDIEEGFELVKLLRVMENVSVFRMGLDLCLRHPRGLQGSGAVQRPKYAAHSQEGVKPSKAFMAHTSGAHALSQTLRRLK